MARINFFLRNKYMQQLSAKDIVEKCVYSSLEFTAIYRKAFNLAMADQY